MATRLRQDRPPGHAPVMLAEVIEALHPADGEVYVDGTFGGGGYARAMVEAADCVVWGIDRDPAAVSLGQALAERYGGRLTVIEGCFANMERLLAERAVLAVDGVALDLGLSSVQLDDSDRGFSFRYDGPLDMRMSGKGTSAADIVNGADEATLARIVASLGEERRARAVARAIVAARRDRPIERTGQLAEIVAGVVRRTPGGVHPATRTFQALRVYLNDELGQLEAGLAASERLLKPGGRLVVVSFHSLEDRRVKQFLDRRAGTRARPSRHRPEVFGETAAPSFRIDHRRARKPSDGEVATNPRARSARFRTALRTAAPAWPTEVAA